MGCMDCRSLALPLAFVMTILAFNSRPAAGLSISSDNLEFEPRRKLLQTENTAQPKSQWDDTARVDPLNHLEKYRGGFDITKKHYWSSIIFTGIWGYVIGVFWLLCGIIYGTFCLVYYCCLPNSKSRYLKRRSPPGKKCHLWFILLTTSSTILAITASGLVLGGSARFHSRANTVLDIIMDTADEASVTIHDTTGAMKGIRDTLQASNQSIEVSNFLDFESHKLDSEAASIQRQFRKKRQEIANGLTIVWVVTTVIISLNLAALVALTVLGFLRLRALYWLIGLCWLLTALCWSFNGAYFFLERFAGDACNAFNNFQENPFNNTLSPILPCNDLRSVEPVLLNVSAEIYNIVSEVNRELPILQVCNPFSGPPEYKYLSGNCPENTVRLRDVPQALKPFTCSETGVCIAGQFISAKDFKTVEAYTSSLQNLLDAYPAMESLLECQLVKDAFSEIISEHCKALRSYDRMVWISMVCLTVIMVMLLLMWVIKAHHEWEHYFSDGSVIPNSEAGNVREQTLESPGSICSSFS